MLNVCLMIGACFDNMRPGALKFLPVGNTFAQGSISGIRNARRVWIILAAVRTYWSIFDRLGRELKGILVDIEC